MKILDELNEVRSQAEARKALRSFIRVRRQYTPQYKALGRSIEKIFLTELIKRITDFVSENSEGGKRAQAVVAGLLDLYAGPERVFVDKINDPDRHMPGDVGVKPADGKSWERVFEVRDKPVSEADLYHFAQKVATAGVGKAAVVAINDRQPALFVSKVRDWAAERNVELVFITGWENFVARVVFWTTDRHVSNLVTARKTIYKRLIQLEVTPAAVASWAS